MKIVISENQYKRLIETEEKPKILEFPSLEFFDNDPFEAWKIFRKILQRKGNPPYSIQGNLYLERTPIQSLGNLKSVGGDLDLRATSIESLGNLKFVGGYLNLISTPIQSLGNLKSVGGYLDFRSTPLSDMYTKEQILQMVNVDGEIYL